MRNNRIMMAAFFSLMLLAAFSLFWVGCSNEPSTAPVVELGDLSLSQGVLPPSASDVAKAVTVQNRHTKDIEAIDGVFGTATSRNKNGQAIILALADRSDVRGVPRDVEGIPVRLFVTDRPELFPKPPGAGGGGGGKGVDLKARLDRPVPIGCSIGNYTECASGTLGCVVTKGGNYYILSNNHVLSRQNAASPGEPIGQPGLFDNKPQCSGAWADTIASVSQFVTVQTGANANNTVDCAIALTSLSQVDCATPATYYGLPNSTPVEAALDMAIQKVGRTTSLTTGNVIGVNATVTIAYAGANTRFVDQILTTSGFSKSGDSGSLIVTNDANANPVGLLFAGNKQGYTWCNRIQNVLSSLNVTICGK